MEKQCPSNHHLVFAVLDDVFNVHIDTLFSWVFSDSDFYRKLTELRKTHSIKLGEWEEDENETGKKVRNLSYTLSINYSIGPKNSPSKEIQTMHPESEPGVNYLIDANCHNGGIPYAGNFHTTIRYCMRALNGNKTKLIVTGKVNFTKSTSSFIKIFIDKTAVSGTRASFNDFVQLLQNEINKTTADDIVDTLPRRRTKRSSSKDATFSNSVTKYYRSSRYNSIIKSNETSYEETPECAGYLIKILIAALLAVSIINVFMYIQILTLESSLERFINSKSNTKS